MSAWKRGTRSKRMEAGISAHHATGSKKGLFPPLILFLLSLFQGPQGPGLTPKTSRKQTKTSYGALVMIGSLPLPPPPSPNSPSLRPSALPCCELRTSVKHYYQGYQAYIVPSLPSLPSLPPRIVPLLPRLATWLLAASSIAVWSRLAR